MYAALNLKNKLDTRKSNLSLCTGKPDIIVLMETWWLDDFGTPEFTFEGYITNSYERNGLNSIYARGGGCRIAVSKKCICSPIQINNLGLEHLFVKVTNKQFKLIVEAAYISPYCTSEVYEQHARVVSGITPRNKSFDVAVFGDYNLPGIQ